MERCLASSSLLCKIEFGCMASGDKYGLYPDNIYDRHIPEGPFPVLKKVKWRKLILFLLGVSPHLFLLLQSTKTWDSHTSDLCLLSFSISSLKASTLLLTSKITSLGWPVLEKYTFYRLLLYYNWCRIGLRAGETAQQGKALATLSNLN